MCRIPLFGAPATVFTFLLILPSIQRSNGSSILFYSSLSSPSHKIAMWPLAEALVTRGHNVNFLNPFPSPQKPEPASSDAAAAVTEYNPRLLTKWTADALNSLGARLIKARMNPFPSIFRKPWNWITKFDDGVESCRSQLDDEEFIAWMRASTFDLIIVDAFFNDCAYGLAAYFNASVILYSTSALYPWNMEEFGLGQESSWIPDMIFHPLVEHGRIPFLNRVFGALHPLLWHFGRRWSYLPRIDALFAEKVPGVRLPPLSQVEDTSVSLIFTNSQYAEEYARSLPPSVVSIGGMQCENAGNGNTARIAAASEISKEVEEFIDGKGEQASGFVYFSFGSWADVFHSDKLRGIFMESFRRLPHVRFLVKSGVSISGTELPNNVLLAKWVPQVQILAHHEIRAVISHGGTLTMHEAICAAVPIITMPIFGEQEYNAEKSVRHGCGIRLEVSKLTTETLVEALEAMLTNSTFKDNMFKISDLFRDRPQNPTETGVWWTEYVLRHMGKAVTTLKPLNISQYWFQKRLLDVWIFLASAVLILIFLLLFTCRVLARCVMRSCQNPDNKIKTS